MLDTGVITTYSLYITIGLLSLLFIVFAPVVISLLGEVSLGGDTSSAGDAAGAIINHTSSNFITAIRLVIIYLASLIIIAV